MTAGDTRTFADLGVSPEVVAELAKRDITAAFPIQAVSIEASLAGRDICGKAPTGSGKTLAFGVPVVDLVKKGTPWRPRALILSPTRELATQIKDELAALAQARGRRIFTVFGGTNIERDIRQLEKGVDILVACPGRLEDLISRRCCELRDVDIVVVDEADRMADMGFLPSVKRILDQAKSDRHTLLYSATLDGDVDQLIKRYQNDPLTYEVDDELNAPGDIDHSWYLIQPMDRLSSAVAVLQGYESAIVFCRTRRGCDRVTQNLKKKGLGAVAIHGDRSQAQREKALKDFTTGRAHVLVATDVAARGIHVDNVSLVMHYDPAGTDKDYIHRSGRTGRAGATGRVISMIVEDKKKIARQLQKDLGVKPGFDDFDPESFPPALKRTPPPREHVDGRSSNKSRGDGKRRDSRGEGRRRDGRKPGSSQGRDRKRRDRDDSDRGGERRGESRGSQRPSRDRDERSDDNRSSRGPRRDRDERGSRGRYDDESRGRRNSGGGAGSGTPRRGKPRSTRDSDDNDNERPRRRRSGGGNDWYPPGYNKGSQPGGRGSSRRGGSSSGRDEEDKPAGGSNTAKRKSRADKGRHADKGASKNKGKRRNKK